jgi:hypothetical protein
MRLHRVGLALAVASLLVACDSGPSGPGTLSATVSGPTPLGAVILEVTGPGVTGFVGQGDTRVYGAEVSAVEGKHRVVAVTGTGGTVRVGIQVLDLGAEPPVVVVLQSVSPGNLVILNTGVTVVIAEPR